MRKRLYILAGAALTSLALASVASASVVVPTVNVASYGDGILSGLASGIGQIFPYAAAVTAFAITVGMVKRWLGHRKATKV